MIAQPTPGAAPVRERDPLSARTAELLAAWSRHNAGRRVAYAYLTVSLLLALVFTVSSDEVVQAVVYDVVLLSTIPAILLGVRRNRPSSAVPWHWFVAALGLFVIAELGRNLFVVDDTTPLAETIVEGLAVLGYGALIAALGSMLRMRRGHRATDVSWDALVVGVATWIVSWTLLIHPTLDEAGGASVPVVVRGLYQPLGVVVAYFVLRLVFTNAFRRPAYWLLSVGLVANLAGDLGYALVAAGRIAVDPARFDPLYMVTCGCLGAAALHPSMRTLTERQPVTERTITPSRAALVAAGMFVPVLVIGLLEPAPSSRIVVVLSSVVLVAAVSIAVLRAELHSARSQERLLAAAHHDPLTTLPNRSRLLDLITDALHRGWSEQTHTAVLFVDLDRFKNINDTLGHASGDALLRHLADRFRTTLPSSCRVGRMSGDEFIVLAADLRDDVEAMDLADALLTSFRAPIVVGHSELYLTASIGVAACPPDRRLDAEELLRNADAAMYKAKDAGRNCAALFDPSMLERIASRLEIETALRRAVERNELQLYYQPVIGLQTGALAGFEALLRWERPGLGFVPPIDFIPIAEDTGLIVPIGRWVVVEALEQLARWIEDGVCAPDTTMSVNVSARQLYDDHLVGVISHAVHRLYLRPDALWLEVTESLMMDPQSRALEVLQRLHRVGVRLAIDDFGTGYSSLSVVKRYPIGRVKVDRSFVSDVESEGTRSLVRAITTMAHSLGSDVVAEGVETIEQLKVLGELGCDEVQGFLFSPAVPPAAMAETIPSLLSRAATSV